MTTMLARRIAVLISAALMTINRWKVSHAKTTSFAPMSIFAS
jgi:hypothetical protein